MAALLDGIFDPQTYAGVQGLLSRLFPQGLQVPTAPGQPDQTPTGPTFARGNFGSMGGVPFPIMPGGPAQGPTTMDLSAQSQQPQMPPQQMQQPAPMLPTSPAQPQSSDLLQRLQAGATNFTTGGNPIAGLLNSIAGFSTGQRTDRMGMMLAQQQATAQALEKSGVPHSLAIAAALNPDVLKTIAPNYFDTKPQFGVIGQSQTGIPQYGFIRPNQEKVTPATVGGAPVGATGGIDPTLTGEDFLKAVTADPQLGPGKAQMVKAIAEGRQPYPSGFLLKTPFGQWLTTAVGQYEPGLDATLIGQRATFNKQLGSATPTSIGGQKTLMGTSLGHLAEVADAAADLGNYNTPIAFLGQGVNAAKNLSTEQAAKANKLNETVDRFSGEVGKLYSGSSGGGVTERDQTRSRFGSNKTPAELAAGLEASRDLIKSKLDALENQQDQIFGPNNKNRVDFLGQNGRAALNKIDMAIAKLRGGQAQTAPASGQAAPGGVIDYREYFK